MELTFGNYITGSPSALRSDSGTRSLCPPGDLSLTLWPDVRPASIFPCGLHPGESNSCRAPINGVRGV